MYRPIVTLLLFVLTGCTLPSSTPDVVGTFVPLPTALPTRGALETSTVAPTTPPPQPSATPDPAVVAERYVMPSGVAALRYPSGWVLSDDSTESEILIKASAPPEAEHAGLFVVTLVNVEGALTAGELPPLAESYLRELFAEEYDTLPISYREEGGSLIATTVQEAGGEQVQFEIRFSSRDPFYQIIALIAAQAEWDMVAPTLDAMARSVEINPERAGLVPTPAAPQGRVGDGLTVQNSSIYEAATGSLYVVGEVLNESAQPYEDLQVTVVLLDQNGAELLRERWAAPRRLLPAGERSPLLVIFSQAPEGWHTYQTSVDGLPATVFQERVTTAFEVTEVTGSVPAFGEYLLSGVVSNTGSAARTIRVIGTLYDESGRVLAVESATLEQDVLPDGASLPFSITYYSKSAGDVARSEIMVEGIRDP